MAELAEQIVIDRRRSAVVIDGVDFPYFIAECGPRAESLSVPSGQCFTVWIPVLTTRLHITDTDLDKTAG